MDLSVKKAVAVAILTQSLFFFLRGRLIWKEIDIYRVKMEINKIFVKKRKRKKYFQNNLEACKNG